MRFIGIVFRGKSIRHAGKIVKQSVTCCPLLFLGTSTSAPICRIHTRCVNSSQNIVPNAHCICLVAVTMAVIYDHCQLFWFLSLLWLLMFSGLQVITWNLEVSTKIMMSCPLMGSQLVKPGWTCMGTATTLYPMPKVNTNCDHRRKSGPLWLSSLWLCILHTFLCLEMISLTSFLESICRGSACHVCKKFYGYHF